MWHSPDTNFTRSAHEFNPLYAFGDYTFKINTTYPSDQWVNTWMFEQNIHIKSLRQSDAYIYIYICVDNLTINGSDNGLSPGQRQAIIWSNAGTRLIGPFGTNFSTILIQLFVQEIAFENVVWKCRPICFSLNMLRESFFLGANSTLSN